MKQRTVCTSLIAQGAIVVGLIAGCGTEAATPATSVVPSGSDACKVNANYDYFDDAKGYETPEDAFKALSTEYEEKLDSSTSRANSPQEGDPTADPVEETLEDLSVAYQALEEEPVKHSDSVYDGLNAEGEVVATANLMTLPNGEYVVASLTYDSSNGTCTD